MLIASPDLLESEKISQLVIWQFCLFLTKRSYDFSNFKKLKSILHIFTHLWVDWTFESWFIAWLKQKIYFWVNWNFKFLVYFSIGETNFLKLSDDKKRYSTFDKMWLCVVLLLNTKVNISSKEFRKFKLVQKDFESKTIL